MNRRPCVQCGADGSFIECAKDSDVFASGMMCDPCLDKALAEAAELRVQFDALIAAGVDRATANALMIERIDARAGRLS